MKPENIIRHSDNIKQNPDHIKIKIEKPEAIKNAESVGVEVFKSREDYEGS